MPVTLNILTAPTVAERAELDHLAVEQRDCVAYQRAWADWLAGNGRVRLWAARFNERIVGSVLTRDDCIEGFAVRRITRHRGVGTRMLQCLSAHGNWRVSPVLAQPTRDFIRLWHGMPLAEDNR